MVNTLLEKEGKCVFCDSPQFCQRIAVREMYFGTEELFAYNECSACHSLNIGTIPAALSSYYPSAGYGGHEGASVLPRPMSYVRRFAVNRRTDFLLRERGFFGRILNRLYEDCFPYPWTWLRNAQVSRGSRILDIGCGGGTLLKSLHSRGFSNLKGVDAFMQKEVSMAGFEIRRQDVMETVGEFDLIMLHHSFEHMPNPVRALLHITTLLAPNGVILMRTPMADCEAYHMFKENWYGIDAPRHLFIPSMRGMGALADKVGLTVFMTVFDSNTSQFVVSEGYRLGLSMIAQRENRYSHVSADRLQEYSTLSKQVNELKTGDQAAFLLRRRLSN